MLEHEEQHTASKHCENILLLITWSVFNSEFH